MTKKYLSLMLVCCFALITASSALAGGPELGAAPKTTNSSLYDGFYVGVDGDISMVTYSTKNNTLLSLTADTFPLTDRVTIYPQKTLVAFGAKVGVGHLFGRHFYFALEWKGQWGGSSSVGTNLTRNDVVDTTNDYNLSQEYHVLFKPGYLFASSTLLYALIGGGTARVTANSFSQLSTGGLSIQTPVGLDARLYGYSVGVGIERQIISGLAAYVSYLYTRYTITSSVGRRGDGLTTMSNYFSVTPSTQTVLIGVSYYIHL